MAATRWAMAFCLRGREGGREGGKNNQQKRTEMDPSTVRVREQQYKGEGREGGKEETNTQNVPK